MAKTLDNAGVVLIAPPRAGRSEQAEIPSHEATVADNWLKDNNHMYRNVEIEHSENIKDEVNSQQEPGEILEVEETSVLRRDTRFLILKFLMLLIVVCLCINLIVCRVLLLAYSHLLMQNRWPFQFCFQMGQMATRLLETHLSVH